MTALSKTALKALWKAYFQPTSADFSNLIDSWTDYKVGLETLGQAVSAGSVGVPRYVSTTTVEFLSVGATGQDLLGSVTDASARSVIGLSGLTLPVSVANGGTGVASLSANHVLLGNGTSAVQLVAPGTSGNVLTSNGTTWQSSPISAGGKLLQYVTTTLASASTQTATFPFDDTIPQSSEGTEIMTLTIVPQSATSTIQISVYVNMYNSVGTELIAALFMDSGTDAKAVAAEFAPGGSMVTMALVFSETTGSTSSRTYKVRTGPSAAGGGTLTINGVAAGARRFGGVLLCRIEALEIQP
jgi:hypothetical protein